MSDVSRTDMVDNLMTILSLDDAGYCFSLLENSNWILDDAINLGLAANDSNITDDIEINTATHNNNTTDAAESHELNNFNVHHQPLQSNSSSSIKVYVDHDNFLFCITISLHQPVGMLKYYILCELHCVQDLTIDDIKFTTPPLDQARHEQYLVDLNLDVSNGEIFTAIKSLNKKLSRSSSSNAMHTTNSSGHFSANIENNHHNSTSNASRFQVDINVQRIGVPLVVISDFFDLQTCTVSTLKDFVCQRTGMSSRNQLWAGLPSDILAGETKINETSLLPTVLEGEPLLFYVNEREPSGEDNLVIVRERLREESSEEEDENVASYYNEDEDFVDLNRHFVTTDSARVNNSRQEELIKLEENDVETCILNFQAVFDKRYSDGISKISFFPGTLERAANASVFCDISLRRPLFIYLHHDNSISANIFPISVFCSDEIVQLINQSNLCIWPWDFSHPINMAKGLTWLKQLLGTTIVEDLSILPTHKFPLLCAISKWPNQPIQVMRLITGEATKEECFNIMENCLAEFRMDQTMAETSEIESAERDSLVRQQNQKFEECLAKDREAQRLQRETEAKEKEQQERQRQVELQKEEALQQRKTQALESLPAEPNVQEMAKRERVFARIKFRFPGSAETITRNFYGSNTLRDVISLVESKGYFREDIKLLTTFPRRDLLQEFPDDDHSLESIGITPQELITVELQ